MKVFFAAFLFAFLSLSATFASDQIIDCKDRKGNILPKTIDSLNSVQASKANRPQVYVEGEITQVLPEDKAGLPHQRFVISAFSKVKIVVVSNLDFGRIPLKVGSKVEVCGEYLNAQGGMVHWTHFDPHGGHPDGFTMLAGKLYGDTEVN